MFWLVKKYFRRKRLVEVLMTIFFFLPNGSHINFVGVEKIFVRVNQLYVILKKNISKRQAKRLTVNHNS